ncbi:MAG: hypothetical protein KDD53_11360, partial [Bdellovibrionales bacterium]|nr:hypothetical protein [Bdellovibrionales bacterium]
MKDKINLVSTSNNQVVIQDFAYHIVVFRHFWNDKIADPYDHNSQIQALQEVTSSNIQAAMPIGVSPTALLVWYPFVRIANIDLMLAYSLWLGFSLTIFFTAFFNTVNGMSSVAQSSKKRILATILAITVLSDTFFSAVSLGQTSILACGCFLTILGALFVTDKENHSISTIISTVLLSLKPSYLAIALSCLILTRRWRTLFHVAIALSILIGGSFFLLPDGWATNYNENLSVYFSADPPSIYKNSIVRNLSNTLVGVFSLSNFSNVAMHVARVIYLTSIPLILIAHAKFKKNETNGAKKSGPLFSSIVLVFLCSLIFAPYLGQYEDLLLWPITTILICSRRINTKEAMII